MVTIGRRTETESELHIPDDAAVEIAETDRGGKSTFHGPGQLVCYPILDLGQARQGREALRARPRGGAHPDARGVRARRRALRRPDWRVDAADGRAGAAQDRVHRRARRPLGDDARVRAERRPRPGAVHGVDHGLRARGRGVHDDGARARATGRPSRTCGPRRSRRSPRSSGSSSRSCPPTTAPGSGASRSTPRSLLDDRRHPPVPPPRLGSAPRRAWASSVAFWYARTSSSSWRSSASPSRPRSPSTRASGTRSSSASKAKDSRRLRARPPRCTRVSRCDGRKASRTALDGRLDHDDAHDRALRLISAGTPAGTDRLVLAKRAYASARTSPLDAGAVLSAARHG